MKTVIGFLLIVAGAGLGLYVGIWICFIGGIVDVINEIKAVEVTALNVAVGVAKVLFAGLFGWLSAIFLVVPGLALAQD